MILTKKELPFFEELSKSEKEKVTRHAELRSYPAGSIIHSRENECLGLIRVMSGQARTFMLSEEGREITLYKVSAGELDVLSAACVVNQITFETQLVADTDCEILVIPVTLLSKLKKDNLHVRCFIFEKLGERFSDTMNVMQEMLFTRIDERILKYLKEEAPRADKHTLLVTHEEIASAINSSREVISRTLKKMEKDGLVRLGRGRVTLL